MVVLRGTAQFVFQVATVEERSEFDAVTPAADPQANMVRELGILGVEITQQIAAAAKGLRAANGVIVVARVAGSSGEVPLLVRDIVRSVNNQPVTSLQGLRDTLRTLKPGTPVALQIQREGRLMYVTFTVN